MIVFKFGGASIKSAEAIKNMCQIIGSHADNKLLVVVSAMGKTTNALESILAASRKGASYEEAFHDLKKYHLDICAELFNTPNEIASKIQDLFNQLELSIRNEFNYDKHYDQVVAFGELLSSTIVAHYLIQCGIDAIWLDSRDYIKTDNNYRAANVNWELTQEKIDELKTVLDQQIILTQGFIGKSYEGNSTTLGREGSDYSAAIFASCLLANSLTVWKDVPGILNADPKLIEGAQLFDELPYKEAAEMTYYGASVIHPKTIKPLANKKIPLFVRSFDQPEAPGTIIHDCEGLKLLPTTIIKSNQCLVSFKVIDYTFIDEHNLSLIFHELAALDIKINLMQNSAISFSIVVDYREDKIEALIAVLKAHFDILYNTGLTLITIKNYEKPLPDLYRKHKNVLLEQISRSNYRALIGS